MIKTIELYKKAAKEAIAAAAAARAAWEVVYQTDLETKAEILRENIFRKEGTSDRILSRDEVYTMSDADFALYCELVYARNLEKGIESGSEGKDYWPARMAALKAEDKCIDTLISTMLEEPIMKGYTSGEAAKRIKSSPTRREIFFSIIGIIGL